MLYNIVIQMIERRERRVSLRMNNYLVLGSLFLVFVSAIGKDELKLTDCGGDDAIMTFGWITDSKTTGVVDKTSVLDIIFSSARNVRKIDSYKTDVSIGIKKKVGFWYVDIPESVMDLIGNAVMDPGVKYLGKSMFRIDCIFQNLYKTCFPPRGPHAEKIKIEPFLTNIKSLGTIVSWFASGWYQLHINATTEHQQNAFCVNLEFDVSM